MAGKVFSILIGAASVLFLSMRAMAEGGPPLIGDDPGTPGANHWEIDVAYIGLRTPRQSSDETPHLDLNYGPTDNIELKYEVGYVTGKTENGHVMTGVNNSLFGIKWRFLDEDKSGIDMSIYPQAAINTSRRLGTSGVIDTGTDIYLPFEIAKTLGKWELDTEWGYQFAQAIPNQFIGGFIVGYKLTDNLELLSEVRTTIDDNFRHVDVLFDGGGRYAINDNIALIAATGRSIRSDDETTSLFVYAGCRVTF